jgi:phosphoribosylformylglycinamidine cyclo-ligase
MPGMYKDGDFDLAGFSVGVVEKKKIIDGSGIKAGDVLIGLPSSGAHSNGFSLVRAIVERAATPLETPFEGATLADALLAPTHIYVKPILKLLASGVPVRGMAHITGGGIPGNLPRCFPKGLGAVVDTLSWTRPPVFDWLQAHGNVGAEEMWRVFNCGVGFVVIVPRARSPEALRVLKRGGVKAWVMGEIVKGKQDVRFA